MRKGQFEMEGEITIDEKYHKQRKPVYEKERVKRESKRGP